MVTARFGILIFMFTFVFAGGCAPQTETIKLFEDKVGGQQKYQRLLVVDISSDKQLRRDFENQIVSGLESAGVGAVASHTKLSYGDGILQDDINRTGRAVGADGILITHIVSQETSVERQEGREDIVRTCRRGDPVDYFLYDSKILKESDSVKLALTVVVVTNLYDASSSNRIWTIQSTCFKKDNLRDVFLEEARAIIQQLRADRLI